MFWHAVFNASEVYGTVRPLVVPRNKALVGSIEQAV